MDSKFTNGDLKKNKVHYNPFETGPLLKAVPSTEAQREIWASLVMDDNATLCYNESLAIDFDGHLNVNAFNIAFQYLLLKHDSLRSVFSPDGKTFYVKEFSPNNIKILDCSAEGGIDVDSVKKSEVELKFDLVKGPCYRATLIKKHSHKFVFLLSAHHIICDGWSFAILLQELSEFYNNVMKNIKPVTQENNQFADFAKDEYFNGINLEHKSYWLNVFDSPLKVNPFPVELKRPAFRTFNSARFDINVNKELVLALKKLGAKEGCSLYSTLMSAFNIFLYNLTKSQDIIVGMASASQPSIESPELVGHMVNLLPLRTDFSNDVPFNKFMKSVRSNMLDAFDHQFYSYGSLVKDLKNLVRDPSQMPLLNVVFNIDQQAVDQGLKFDGIKSSYKTIARDYENFEVFINAVSCGDEIALECQYNTNLFTSAIIENWFSNFLKLMNLLVENPSNNIKSFSLPYLKIPALIVTDEIKSIPVLVRNPQIEDKIKNIWSQVLLNNSIDVNDNFFAVGGHSLLAIEVATLLESEFKKSFSIKDIFENPTILNLSHKVGSSLQDSKNKLPALVANALTSVNVSHNQMQVWYLEEMHPQTLMHNLPASIRIKSQIDRLALEKTLHFIIERHPSLRTAIVVEDGVPVQKILDKNLSVFKFELELINTTESEILGLLNRDAQYTFDKTMPPLLKAKLYQLGPEDYVFFFMVHHAVWDGWSFDIFFEELNTVYSAFIKNELPNFIKNPDVSYADYSSWLHNLITEKSLNQQINYWEEKLRGPLPIMELPLDYKRPLVISHEGATFPFTISSERTHNLREYAKTKNSSLFNVFLTAFKITLSRYSGLQDVIVGLPVRGRNQPEIMQTIGYFVNTIALRTQINLNQSFEDNLKQVSNTCLEAFDNQLIPFQIVLNKINYPKDTTRTPIFQTFFSYQDVSNRSALLNGNPYTQINIDKASTHTDLDLWIKSSDRKIEGAFEYRKDLFKEISIERFKEGFFHTLDMLIENESKPLNITKAIPLNHEDQIMLKWNDTWTKSLEFPAFHKIFEQNALHNPDTIAIEMNEDVMTYGELNLAAIRCANALLEKGVGRGQLVGISLTRSKLLIATILGVLKTGAGYVPLDPGFPQERLDYMIESSTPKILITEESLADRFKHIDKKLIISDIFSNPNYDKVIPNVKHEMTDTIYVIYTSGSTGNPKGVQLTHGSVTNFLLSMKEKIKVGLFDKILAVTTLSFDIAVLELFLPLITGSTIFLATSSEAMDGSSLKNILENKGITTMQATPSTWRLLLASGWKGNDKLKILCGGESFPIDLAKKLIPICREVWNMYGPTETTVWSTCKQLKIDDEFITIGRPIANTTLYILDDNRFMRPIGATGELFIGGLGLAHGYFGREDLTNERFIPDPFITGGKMYATGDIARFTHDGEVECLGRNDGQVKVRGYRIELGEIEAEIQKISGVSVVAVITSEYRPGDVRIFAYYSTSNGVSIEDRIIRETLNKMLPSYMIPSHFTQLQQIPQTLNGKIDKKSLPKIQINNAASIIEETKSVENHNEIKENLRLLWIETLGINDLLDSDNFFNVGGNSLLAVQLFSRIASVFKVNMPLASLLEADNFKIFAKNFEEKFHPSIEKSVLNDIQGIDNESIKHLPQLFKSIVAIKTIGTKTPLLCFHGVGGNILNYVTLIPALKNERSLMGIQSVGLDGVTPPLRSIEEMAQSYIREIRLIQPTGPYLLAGGSMGGMIAFEVALQLTRSGDTIEKLIMFDTYGPNLDLKSFKLEKSRSFITKIKDAFHLRAKFWSNKILTTIYRSFGVAVPIGILLSEIERKNYQAIWSYHPKERLDGDLHLIRSHITPTGWYSDPNLGWNGVINGKIKTYEISGTHSNFVESPELVNVLKQII